jgi:hypothetical protein
MKDLMWGEAAGAKKVWFLMICILSLVALGCADYEKDIRTDHDKFIDRIAGMEVCLKGVVYYNGNNRLTPAFKPDGSLYTCEVK